MAAFFFLLGAEFVGLVQVFVYVGAVAVLIVFTILLTRREVKAPVAFNWSGAIDGSRCVWRIALGDFENAIARHCRHRKSNRSR